MLRNPGLGRVRSGGLPRKWFEAFLVFAISYQNPSMLFRVDSIAHVLMTRLDLESMLDFYIARPSMHEYTSGSWVRCEESYSG